MNNYPEWWDTTLTIFNKYRDPQTNLTKWYKTTVTGCFWKYVGNKITIDKTVLETNSVICRIPRNSSYLSPFKWRELSNDNMSNYFTLCPGDIIVEGEVDDTIDETTSGKRSTDLITKYKALQGVMTITRTAINVGEGRVNEHYYVLGE